MPVDSKPHSSWADVYDLVYEHSFRNFYHELTNVTLSVIEDRVNSNSRIVDFGAGTGRLSIPLSKKGFDVVAVDPCEEMLAQLKQKQQNGKLQTICLKMENFTTDDKLTLLDLLHDQQEDAKFFLKRGASKTFTDQMYKYEADDMWYPPIHDLKRYGVVHKILE
ncbi:MAG: class I SAM-dependent methyltransferase [Candidatus Ruthia sp.]|nr:class I SAM-dependent methyltransferase [Candidatus Ruthturnera sp.]